MNKGVAMTTPTTQEWKDESVKSVNLEELDQLVAKYKELRSDYEDKKARSNEASALMDETKNAILLVLMNAGKSKYFVDGLGTVYTINKYVVRTPKELEKLRALRCYIQSKYGPDAADQLFTVNHQTLNSFVNKEIEAVNDPSFVIPGLEAPILEQNLGFRKDDK